MATVLVIVLAGQEMKSYGHYIQCSTMNECFRKVADMYHDDVESGWFDIIDHDLVDGELVELHDAHVEAYMNWDVPF